MNTIIYSGSQKDFEKIETSFSPNNFKRTLGGIKTQFQKFEANNFKGLILYLMQTIHKELNYFGVIPLLIYLNQINMIKMIHSWNL